MIVPGIGLILVVFFYVTLEVASAAGPVTQPQAASTAGALVAAPPIIVETAPLVEMVRSLKATQDRLAVGDQDALKASQEQVNAIAVWLSRAPTQVWQDRRNVRALAVFLLGGGSVGVARKPIEHAKLDESDRNLVNSVLAYGDGRFDDAQGLKLIDALSLEPLLGAHVALAQATIVTATSPEQAYRYLAHATLLAPGTLVEEAALRRQIIIAASHNGIGSLARALGSYLRRFASSVYRPALIDAIITSLGARKFETKDEFIAIVAAFDQLTREEKVRIGLLLTEIQIASGRLEWVREVADQTVALTEQGSREHARAQLFRAVSNVLMGQSGQTGLVFDAIDPRLLSAGDETLLKAAKEIALAINSAPLIDTLSPAEKPVPLAVFARAQTLVGEVDKLMRQDLRGRD